ncbi:hypothetical protein V8F20_005619 [Naviculisporaceae sp. PSN 640]
MAPIWNPRLVLGLRTDDQTEWRCVGTSPSTESPGEALVRCDRLIRPSELGKLNRLLAAMSQQMPDQIDHNELLHLARACLCPDMPNPHRGAQEAAVIYQWTELMSAEACELRSSSPRSLTDADLGLPQSPRARTFDVALSSPPLYAPKPKPARMASLPAQPRLLTNLKPEKKGPGVLFPTPIAMDRSPVRMMERKVETESEKWETETVIPSPLSSLPFCFSPTTAKDIEKLRRINNNNPSAPSLSGTLSIPTNSTPATSPSLIVNTQSSLPAHTIPAAAAGRELPPSPPLSAVSPQAPVSLHTHLVPPQPGSAHSTVELSPGDRIITTSFILPAQTSPQLQQVPLTSPLDAQKLDECSRLLNESRAENRLLVNQISALRSELAEVRREQANIQAVMVLLMWLIQAISCFPLVVMGWAEGIFEGGSSAVDSLFQRRRRKQESTVIAETKSSQGTDGTFL